MSLSEGKFDTRHTAFFDLFRIEKGKIVEHWDVLQEVPEKMAHDNGMFKLPLYRRLGGYDAIAGFVDFAFPRVAGHPALAHFFIGHSHESKYRQRQLIVDKICSALQGPVVYIGRPLAISPSRTEYYARTMEYFYGNNRECNGRTRNNGRRKTGFYFHL